MLSDIKYFWPSMKPYKWHYMVMFMASIVSSFYTPVSYYAIKLIIDIITNSNNFTYNDLIFPLALFLAANLFHEVFWRLSNIAQWLSEPYVQKDIILRTYDYIQHHSYRFFQDSFVGSLTTKVKDISRGYRSFREAMHWGFVLKLMNIILAVIALVFIQPSIGIFILLWGTVICTLMYFFSKKLLKLSSHMSLAKQKTMGLLADRFSNILSVMAFSAYRQEVKALSAEIDKNVIPREVKLLKYDALTHFIQGILYVLMLVLTVFILIEYKKAGLITVGDFAFVMSIVFYLIEQIWYLIMNLQEFSLAMGDLHSALGVIKEKHEFKDAPDAEDIRIVNPSIEFKNAYFSYNKKKVFQDFNLNIKAGEKIGIVGYSGGGKSTLISLILKYFHLNKGELLIAGTPISKITKTSLRKHVSIIPQDIMLFHNTLLENIRYSKPLATKNQVIEAAEKAHIHEYIMTLPQGYNTLVGERGVKISVGQRQRIAIARAILKNSPILILDEATSSLDSKTEKYIQQSIDELLDSSNKTIIAIAHRLSTIRHMDRIVVIDNGEIVEEGKHSSLLKNKGIYDDLWHHQKI
jgi:ATP-binding cassette, subfamily B, bacterial